MSRINQAVSRILTLKFQLGLFDHPASWTPARPAPPSSPAADVTLKAAQESMTLLRNQNNALPLPASSKIVVTGPSADSMTNQLGGWSVSWQGVFGVRPRAAAWARRPDPAGHHGARRGCRPRTRT